MLSFEQALEKIAGRSPACRRNPLAAADSRCRAHFGPRTTVDRGSPALDNSAMDGYAVRLADIAAKGVRLPVSQRIPAGTVGTALQPGTAARIFTGAPVPAGADAVVMQELCEHGEGGVVINHLPRSGENIRRAGEDISVGAEILRLASNCSRRTSPWLLPPVCPSCRSIVGFASVSSSPAMNWCNPANHCRRGRSTTRIVMRWSRCLKVWAAKCAIWAQCRTSSTPPAKHCARRRPTMI